MVEGSKRDRRRDLLIGGVLGAFATLAALRRKRPLEQATTGLVAFEQAPCYREAVESELPSRRS